MQTWQLPEHIADILPDRARQLESVRARILAQFNLHGYELVQPPLLEYSDSLLTHIDKGLSLKTVRFNDQLSGRQLGIRADITPQAARIDAHLLAANEGINRLCYCASVLHAKPDGLLTTREPYQTGAELYGCADIHADIELIGLMLKTLHTGGIAEHILSLGHLGVFRALADAAGLTQAQSRRLLETMQNKDRDAAAALAQQWLGGGGYARALAELPALYGGADTLARARAVLPPLPEITAALDDLQQVCDAFAGQNIHIDLAEVRVDNYHTGLLYAAYSPDHHDALARGGRYDGLGAYFGRSRPATGFSLDLKLFTRYLPEHGADETVRVRREDYAAARAAVEQLRAEGIAVVVDYGLPDNCRGGKTLACKNGRWLIE